MSSRTSEMCLTYSPLRFFFFSSRRRHTRCYRDWSSDVCSSDLEMMPQVFIYLRHHLGQRLGASFPGGYISAYWAHSLNRVCAGHLAFCGPRFIRLLELSNKANHTIPQDKRPSEK